MDAATVCWRLLLRSGRHAARGGIAAERTRGFATTACAQSVLDKFQKMFSQARQERLAAASRGGRQRQPASPGSAATQNGSAAAPVAREEGKSRTTGTKRQRRRPSQSQSPSRYQPAFISERRPADSSAWMPRVFKDFYQPEDAEVARIVILGAANAGKSTLINRLTGVDVSIVSARPQTTRTRIMTSSTAVNKQLVFLDTPGVVSKQALHRVSRSVVTTPWQALTEADVVVLFLDAFKLTAKTDEVEKYMFAQLARVSKLPAILVVNKIDLVKDRELLKEKIQEYVKLYPHIAAGPLFMSALGGVNVEELRELLLSRTQPGKWVFPHNVATDMSPMMQVEELVRAEWFELLTGHLPYIVKQRNTGWEHVSVPREQREYTYRHTADTEGADSGGKMKRTVVERTSTVTHTELAVCQEIVVPSASVAKILVGTGGEAIIRMTRSATSNISKALNMPVRLSLQVVVEKDTRRQK
ncbi:hypothetical protein GGI11_002313 [Coemansia sp. RSA 2049]|nr:hypothetical protein H4217_003085 [Coemansia sp. RSA 1939]KAJ2520366.1 hypothetical protein GGI11_002313 [Coemansia sp. RSA 2049]KAJ2616749.1 hypothetical protein EV177_000913 [Coemansia sp. RSA 1804]